MCESVSFSIALASKRILSQTTKVRVIVVRQDDSLVADFVIFLAQKRNSSATQFNDKSILVDDFVVSLPQLAMDLHAKAHELENLLLVRQLTHSCELVKFVSRVFQGGLCNSVYSHSLANSQSRLTVTREILSTSAISS